MMVHRFTVLSRRRAVVLSTWVAVLSVACAASEQEDEPQDETGVVVPSGEAGAETSADAAPDVDTPAVPCSVGVLCTVPSPLTIGSVMAIRGRSKSDVWASGSQGLLMHWDGQRWTDLDSGMNDVISSIFLTSDETWGVAGTLVVRRRLDRDSVRTFRIPGRPYSSITVFPKDDVYVSVAPDWAEQGGLPVARRIPLARVDLESQQLVYPPDPIHPSTKEPQLSLGAFRASSLVPDKALWFVGDRGVAVRYPVSPVGDGGVGDAGDGGGPSLGQGVVVPLDAQVDFGAAWAHGEELWAATRTGAIFHFDGAEWHEEKTGTTSALTAIFGFAPNDIWAAGENGVVLHFDGAVWSRTSLGPYRGHLKAIWGTAPDDVWIGGERVMLHWGALP
jgi:hypothetical protein